VDFETFRQQHASWWEPKAVGRAAARWQRAVPIAQRGAVSHQLGQGRHLVASCRCGSPVYQVQVQTGLAFTTASCNCPDITAPWGWCKHALAAFIARAEGRTVPVEKLCCPACGVPLAVEISAAGAVATQPVQHQEDHRPRCPAHQDARQGKHGLYCPHRAADGSWCQWVYPASKRKAA
jgi:hypothetical protein